MIGVGELLREPPGIFAAAAVVVIAVADPVELDGVDGVAEHVFEGAVGSAVPGDFGVAMVLAAQILKRLAGDLEAMLFHALDGGVLGGQLGCHLILAGIMRDQYRRHGFARQVDGAEVNLIVDVVRRCVTAIGVVDDDQPAGAVRQQNRAMIEQAVGMMHLDRLAPRLPVEPAAIGEPVGAGVAAVARAEVAAIGQPNAAAAIDADLRIPVAAVTLEQIRFEGVASHGRRLDGRGRQLRGGRVSICRRYRGRRRAPNGRCRADCLCR